MSTPTGPARVALVTGGTRGIGAAVVRRLAQEGVPVGAVYRSDDEAARQLQAQLADAGHVVTVHRAELGEVAECRRVVAEVVAAHGPVTLLVNNAGLLVEERVTDVTEQAWDQVLAVNLRAPFFLAQAVWDGMVAARFGRIVNISSITAVTGNSKEAAYGSAKAGLSGLTRSLALAGARRGITVNNVLPGVFETDMTNGMAEADQQRIAAMIPLGRRGLPAEIAHVVVGLLAEDAGYTSGTDVLVGGALGMGI